jgi:hypothetical protein
VIVFWSFCLVLSFLVLSCLVLRWSCLGLCCVVLFCLVLSCGCGVLLLSGIVWCCLVLSCGAPSCLVLHRLVSCLILPCLALPTMSLSLVRVYHFGSRFNVEMEIVLPGSMTVRESHDIALALQHKIESLKDVERAFVHVDYLKRDGLEHKVERELVHNLVNSTASSRCYHSTVVT